ncbi:uncharacterized protein LOC111569300 [Amphiprion ocellaris]|uniref:uncharacterized protein LOC111569300 n=1 Tax=Amphiprion ocellaris TaxID=80972 RepID=UPI002410F03A|nr:uncharacterized protein LOC111569300 [Amphiprion ocellaris]XP_054872157.1 uncharacterized protein LOC111569300 [Amphiprion ocellaris]XP_054872159.1 uncharacterized protein LOC111569300 [Amphiprion ocellaris]XP_054872166.1 uncharacterized protein LOC111569300 [Amphiprion ocellaris]XP_054872168.1 uncharacterized protein LOC111569300 [Amphiprion ocellaris]
MPLYGTNMDVQMALPLLCLLLLSELFKSASGDPFSHGSIVYSREQLLALSQARPPSWERPDIPAELRRRRRGCRAGLKRREKRRRYKPSVPSVIMGNVRSLPNKMEELTALTRLQWEYRESSLMMFMESWLNELTPDSLLTLDGFHLVRADRNARESGKRKGGGLAMYVNERWCNAGHISVKEQLCTKDVELLVVSLRPFYLPREYSHVIAITVYIPPSADAAAACELIHSVVSQLQTSHPQSLIIISGDFNHASLSATLPTFTQYVTCHTRDNKTLDLLYANIKDAYSSSPLPPLGHSDHNLVRLQPIYIPMVKKQPPTTRYVKKWSDEATEALQDCFETTDWDVLCGPHEEDIDSLTDTITDYINFCAENIVPTRKVRCFSNNKPWVSLELKALLKEKRRVFGSGDKEELRRVQKEIKKKIKVDKASYRTKMESYLQENNTREVWRDLRAISVDWCERNHLQLNASKTKEMIVDFSSRRTPQTAPVNIQGLDIDMVDTYKYLGVHLNNKMDWTHNTEILYKKDQSGLHLLRRLRSFGVCRTLLRTFYDSVVASAIFYAVVCWGAGSTERDRKRLNRLVRRAGSVLDCSLDSIEEVGERRMLAKLTSIMDNPSHPLHDTVGSLSSSFSSRLRHPPCKKERYRRSFIPSAIRLYNISITG